MANIKEIILEYGGGSISAAARRMDVTPGYLSGVANHKRPASKLVRDALGIDMRRTVTIEYFERVSAPDAGRVCVKCGQALPDVPGIGGEYPCPLCGVPICHDQEWEGAQA